MVPAPPEQWEHRQLPRRSVGTALAHTPAEHRLCSRAARVYNFGIPKTLSPESHLSVLFLHSTFQMDPFTGNFFLFFSPSRFI